ncbi:similar to Saccharomyces cerevisiae YGR021W Putative protein of unknown function [Maudiozyma barnettii]|uniref:Transcriptional regulatory protein n=1 Tax=Maudiozyma barnettii TaxID=61262 RepID=A0A8H2VK32_9SACH|nr:Dpc29p [Kazachstania barnettii]CAB4256769.1 similar to Saccharomyces cerevisiae YGR021W Putative protein of unknown function [Kazachstania barnettii]CAD1785422.1 similar to Saccharomyces cerevisiae YGR021W Putative protein of unknown function [Kazachstania barnettii]
MLKGLAFGSTVTRVAIAHSVVRPLTTTVPRWSGHNKWSTIKHDKMKNDSAKNKVINKYVNQIMVAIKLKDTRLQAIIDTAMKGNVPKKVIDNAIKKASGAGATEGAINIYEGMGPGGVALIIETQTDNKNRTVALVRSHFTKSNLNLLSMGSSMHYFDKVGHIVVTYPQPEGSEPVDEGTIFDKIIEVEGVEDFEKIEAPEDESATGPEYIILTEPSMTNKVAKELQDSYGFEVTEANIGYQPKSEMQVDLSQNEDIRNAFNRFIDGLREIDDVTEVYSNETQ